MPNLYRHSKRKNSTIQEALQQRRWINDIRHNLTIPLLDEFLWEVLARDTPQLTEEVQDLIVLRWTTDGEYSAKSAYQFQFNGMVLSPSTKLSWEEWASANCKIFSWLVLQNRVWTANQLQIRRWPNNYFCQLCFQNLETVNHLLFECPISKQIWFDVLTQLCQGHNILKCNNNRNLLGWWTQEKETSDP